MENKFQALLFQIIDSDSSIKKLIHYGLTYKQIGDLIETCISKGFLDGSQEEVKLTDKGRRFLEKKGKLIKERDKSKWIEPDFKNKITQISKEDVFLPSRFKMSFLK